MNKSKYYQEELKEQECYLPSPFTRQPFTLLWIYFTLAFLSGNCLVASNSMQLLTFHLGYLAWIPISDAELLCNIAVAVGMSINFLGFLLTCVVVRKIPINLLACSGFIIHSLAWLLLAWYRTYSALVISFSCIGLGNAFVYIALQSIAPSFSCEKVELEILAFLSIPDAIGILLPKLFLSLLHLYPAYDGCFLLSWSCILLSVAVLSLFLFPHSMPLPRQRPLFLFLKKCKPTHFYSSHDYTILRQSRLNKGDFPFTLCNSTALLHPTKEDQSFTHSHFSRSYKTLQQHEAWYKKNAQVTSSSLDTTFLESFNSSQSETNYFSDELSLQTSCMSQCRGNLTFIENNLCLSNGPNSLVNIPLHHKKTLYSLYINKIQQLPVSLYCTLLERIFNTYFLYKHEKILLCPLPTPKPLVHTPSADSSDTINFNTLFEQPIKNRKKNAVKEQITRRESFYNKTDIKSNRTFPKRPTRSKNMFAASKTRHMCVDIVLEKAEDVQSIMELEMAALNKNNAISTQLDADLQVHTTSGLTMFHYVMIFVVLGWIHFVDIEFLITLRSKLETVSPNHRVTDFYMNLFEFTLASVPQTAFCLVFVGCYSHVYIHWKDIIGCLGIIHFFVLFSLAICLVQITCVWLVCFLCIFVFHSLSRGLAFLIFFFLYGKNFSSHLKSSFFVCQAMSCILWIVWHIFCSSLPITPQTTRTYTLMILTLLSFFPLTLLYMLEPPLQKYIPEMITLKQSRRIKRTTHAQGDCQFQNPTVNQTDLSTTRPSISIIILLLRVLPHTLPTERCCFRCHDASFYSDYYGRAWTP